MTKRIDNRESGAIAIDAILGITVFLISMCTIMFLSFIIRIEAKMQYAVNQTAKEISSYYYVLDTVGLAKFTSSGSSEDKKAINSILDGVSDLASATGGTLSSINIDLKDLPGTLNRAAANRDELVANYQQAQSLYAKIKDAGKNPMGLMKGALLACAHSFSNRMIAPFLCRMIMPKYIESDDAKRERYYKTLGLEHGIDDIDFYRSSLMDDNRTVKIVAVYQVNLKELSFGLLDIDMTFCKTAVTAAWCKPDGKYVYTLAEAYKKRGGGQKAEADKGKDEKESGKDKE